MITCVIILAVQPAAGDDFDGTWAIVDTRTQRQADSLNNSGDIISLVDSSGCTGDSYLYTGSSEDVRITTGH